MADQSKAKTPAEKRLRYVQRLTLLLALISVFLVLIYALMTGGNPADPGFEPDYLFAGDDSQTSGSSSDTGAASTGQNGSAGDDIAMTIPGEGNVSEQDRAAGQNTGTEGFGGNQGAASAAAGSTDSGQDAAVAVKGRPKLIIVIDDVGYNLDGLKPFLKIPVPITFAVLPQLDYSEEAAKEIRAAGQELIMHLPMESLSGQYPGPGTITAEMSDDELRRVLDKDVRSVPGIIGMNNHMGSAGTEDIRIMRDVLEYARDNSLFFLDSKTTPRSVAPLMAEATEIPFIERDVFLDNKKDKAYIMNALETGKAIAREKGSAVLIGHVWTEELADVLLENYSFILDEGYDFATLSSVIMKGE